MTAHQEIREIGTQRLIEDMQRLCESIKAKAIRMHEGEVTSLDDKLELSCSNLKAVCAKLYQEILSR